MSGEAIPYGAGPQTRYRVNSPFFEPIDTINDTINISGEVVAAGIGPRLLRLVEKFPGKGAPFLMAALTVSRPTLARAVAALVAEGKIEHRGSKKTGGYYAVASGWFLTTKHTKSEKCFGVETHEIVFE